MTKNVYWLISQLEERIKITEGRIEHWRDNGVPSELEQEKQELLDLTALLAKVETLA